jgi:hypothetical protein
VAAQAGAWLYPGDLVRVPASGAASLAWDDDQTHLDLGADTELRLLNPLRGKRFVLGAGVLRAEVAPQLRWRPLTLVTAQARAVVVGTRFSLSATGGVTRLEVLEGGVRLYKTLFAKGDTQKDVLVQAGEQAVAAPGVKLEAQVLTGFLASEAWAVPPGTTFAEAPAQGMLLTSSEAPAAASSRVERLRGYVIAPATGDFTFWVASFKGEAPAELWLSTSDDPGAKRLIASVTPRSPGRNGKAGASQMAVDWERSPSQKSPPQPLVRGRRYYIEVWHEGGGLGALALGWRLPGEPADSAPQWVDINALCPFVDTVEPDGHPGKRKVL